MTTPLSIFIDKESVIQIKGSINLYNCIFIKKKYINYEKKLNEICIDFSNLHSNDSSIILIIINIIRISKSKKIKFFNFSVHLKNLIKSYKLEYIFKKYS